MSEPIQVFDNVSFQQVGDDLYMKLGKRSPIMIARNVDHYSYNQREGDVTIALKGDIGVVEIEGVLTYV